MKKQNLLKLAFTVMAMFLFLGAMAQAGTAIPGQAVPVAYATDAQTYVVVGDNIPLYALPDAVYHSSWDYATANWTLTAGFLWNWSRTGDLVNDTGLGTLTFSQTGVNDNYVEISVDQVGQYEIQVTEEAPLAYGGCEGAPTTLIIQAVAIPDATLEDQDAVSIADASVSYCVGDTNIPTAINAVISGGWQNYRLVWSLEIATLGGSPLAKDAYYATDLTTELVVVLPGDELAVNNTTASPELVALSGDNDIMSVANFIAIDPDGVGPLTAKPTVYTFTLTSINDQAYRFGDFITLSGVDTTPEDFRYNPIGETYTIQINPAPTTGPIYHIPATWAL